MITASVRELRTEFPRLEALLHSGESIAITKHRRVVARLIPEKGAAHPDFRKRFSGEHRKGGLMKKSAVAVLVEERGE